VASVKTGYLIDAIFPWFKELTTGRRSGRERGIVADRRVTQSRKNAEGDITALCNPSENWSPRLKADVIRDIESELHAYFVDRARYRTNVRVVNAATGKYLRTEADPRSENNLDNLPGC
jgi:hypothetical protein